MSTEAYNTTTSVVRRIRVKFPQCALRIRPMTANDDDLSDFVDQPSKPKKKAGRRFRLIELLTVLAIIAILVALLLPAVGTARPAALRAQCTNNLKQIALALYNYDSTYKALPPAYTVDSEGKPLHSWRTLILPYLDEQPLYASIDLSKSWNDPANAKAYKAAISVFRCPGADCPKNVTTYLAIVGPERCFRPAKPRHLSEITDDHGETLMVIDVDSQHAVHWMGPVDADETVVMAFGPSSKLNHPGRLNAAYVDASVQFLKSGTPAAEHRALISIAGNDK
jgi:prepilin-type processing-associated H-X9-DG protein